MCYCICRSVPDWASWTLLVALLQLQLEIIALAS
jgi:hypothetical protein